MSLWLSAHRAEPFRPDTGAAAVATFAAGLGTPTRGERYARQGRSDRPPVKEPRVADFLGNAGPAGLGFRLMGARALALRRDEAVRVIACCGDDPRGLRDAALVTLMREAMLRSGEAAALVWRDIATATASDHAAVVAIRRSKTNTRGTRAEAVTISATALHRLELWRPHAGERLVFGLAARSCGLCGVGCWTACGRGGPVGSQLPGVGWLRIWRRRVCRLR